VAAGALRELREETGFGPDQIAGFYDLDQVNQFHEPSVGGVVRRRVFAVRGPPARSRCCRTSTMRCAGSHPTRRLEMAVWPAYRESIRRIVENLLDVRETAAALGVSENTAKARLKTGLARLREWLDA
jgi:8-oxo-dGTP pyrophosphatase MutT (NUDIX family)